MTIIVGALVGVIGYLATGQIGFGVLMFVALVLGDLLGRWQAHRRG